MQSLKIKTVLRILTMAFAIVPMLIVGIVGYFATTGFAVDSVGQLARAVGTAQQETINQYLNGYISDVVYLSLDPSVLNGRNVDTGKLGIYADSVIKRKLSFEDSIPVYNDNIDDSILNIVITDTKGEILYEYEEVSGTGMNFFGFSELENITANTVVVSNIYCGDTGTGEDGYDRKYPVFFVAKGIPDLASDSGEAIGVVIEVIDTAQISAILKNTKYGSDNSGYLAVTDGKGCVLNYEGADYKKISEITDQSMKDEVLLSTKKSAQKDQHIEYNVGSKIGNYDYFTGSTSQSWKWVSVYPASFAGSQIMIPVLIALGVMLACGAVCVLLGMLVTKSIIEPMNTMVSVAREIQDGDLEKRLELKTKNEFKEISELFNNMLDDVSMSEELHRTISDISDNMLFEWDFHKEIMYVSDNFKERFDIDPTEAQLANGKFLDKLMSDEYAESYKRDISTLLKNRTGHSGEYQMVTKNGTMVWFAVRALCVTDRLGEPLRVVGVVTDIDSEKKLELQLSERASYDFLSQLYNRSTFERELKSEIERSANANVAVLFIDVDDFKFINDRFGHSVGDEVIKYVSGCIKQRVKGSGFAGRFGGDEFVLCITDPDQIKDIESLSLDLIDELYEGYHSELANVSINVKASIGIAFYPEHGDDSAKVVAAADEAMYFVKKNGKANYHIYQPEDSQIEDLQHTL